MDSHQLLKVSNHCEYCYREAEDIHHIIYHAVGRRAVDEFMSLFEMMLQLVPTTGTIRLIVDNRIDDEPQPLNYMFGRLHKLIQPKQKRAAVRVAIVYHKKNPLFALIDAVFRSLRQGRDRLRYFHRDNWDMMISWLKADD
jgi:hypothetical protein